MGLLRDHSGKLSFGRIMMLIMFLVALAFFGKAWYNWASIPDGVIAGISSLSGALAAWIKVTQFIDSKIPEIKPIETPNINKPITTPKEKR